ncbi:folylpolyglutamate synthase [Ureibacillus massiliensis 4400831 = CIP 108448 = CCUG 49529]|uniref:tetrahydrofolate synthase n=1 Tax=Ureibacillus massiliensis 4400831 = CIP 108448 = CCUG 49529 TaxID=1211035 RepID=A0A0A3J5J7_9BACL|nr:folylpolyglutamate synthase/dihydrofolate synthase family protein [Ureibacillus massiliensis]KGR90438.1 folylpolyglutamate synthase [Ureibacillus massiliensis 4400831 = CIP 108448 = CCUG 49529]
MFHSIEECTNFIFQLRAGKYKGKPLEAVRIIMNEFGNPHQKVKFIHYAGSNGKGSTLNATKEILMIHGLKVAAFTSPHLERVNERITINNEQITDEQFVTYANQVAEMIEKHLNGLYPSFFEVVMLIAFLHFANSDVDVALIETGIGGRVDSTNMITPAVSIITTISLEHTEILGDTYEKIAYEKAGIIKPNVPAVVGVKNEEALHVIKQKAKSCQADLYILGNEFQIQSISKTSPQVFNYQCKGKEINGIQLAMEGEHQVENAALAITASLLFDSTISEDTVYKALAKAKWEGRFERMNKQIIIDGAHNSEGTRALIRTLHDVEPNKRYKFIYAALQDKDHQNSIAMMDEVADKISFTEIPLPRAAKAEHLASQSKCENIVVDGDWEGLIEREIDKLNEDELLVITGSLYFIAEVRKFLQTII